MNTGIAIFFGLSLIALVFSSVTKQAQAQSRPIYNGTFIDAHCQVGKLISNEKVSEMILKGDVDFTLLSFIPPKRKLGESFQKIEELTEKSSLLNSNKIFLF
jgi:hypothetical protein